MGINRKQFLLNEIVRVDPTKSTDDILNGDIEETYWKMVNNGTIPASSTLLSTFITGLGTADDTAIINAAIVSTTPKEFIVPDGTWNIAGTVNVPAGITLTLRRGAKLLKVGTDLNPIVNLSNDATLQGPGTIDGATIPTYALNIGGDRAAVRNLTINAPNLYGIHCYGYADSVVDGNRFTAVPSYAYLCESTSARPVFRGNTVVNTTAGSGQGCMVKNGPTNGVISGNLVSVGGTVGIEVFGATTSQITVSGNTVIGASIGVSVAASQKTSVTGNVITTCATYGIEMAEGTTHSTVTGNTITSPGTGIVISKGGSATNPRSNTVSGNTIRQSVGYGIDLEFADDCIISNNIIDDPGNRAIFHNNAGNRCIFSGNHIRRITAVVGTNGDGIYLTGTDHLVTGNLLDYSGLTTQAGYGIYSNSGSRIQMIGNKVYGTLKAFALTGGTLYTLVGNHSYSTTEHSVYTSGTTVVVVDSHSFFASTGLGVDMSGSTNARVGSVYNANTDVLTSSNANFTSTLLGFYGVAPVARAAAIASPASDTVGTKAAIDAIRVALTNLGLTS